EVRHIIQDIANLAQAAADGGGVSMDEIESIGIGIPGIANDQTGIVEYAVNLYWHDVPVREMLGGLTGKQIRIDNDANSAAYGEYIAGAAKNSHSALAITLGTGIGGGLIIDGSIYEGYNFGAMEVGHMVIRKGGRPCPCGRLGCFERYTSALGLAITTRDFMADHPESMIWDMVGGDINKVEGRTAFDAMDLGDAVGAAIVSRYIDDLACGVTSLINIFQPEIVCVGGGISGRGESLIAPLREIVAKEVYTRESAKNTRIVRAVLGNDAGIIGAANLYRIKRQGC
ncbi:MAG: ROK family protein, partial [Clostridiales Family XIII bacterium]|nr:ROK family protein [Clostridiales Family XIII bacterium]